MSPKQHVEFLNQLGEVLRHLGSRAMAYWPALLGTVLNLIASTQARLEGSKQSEVPAASSASEAGGEEEEEREDNGAGADSNADEGSTTRTVHSVRQLGFRRLADFPQSHLFQLLAFHGSIL